MSETLLLYGYLRVSGHGQIDGDGFYRQTEAIEEFVRQNWQPGRNKPHILEFGREAGISGTKEAEDRPLLAQCLVDWEDPEKRPYAVIVERLDRFARDLMVQECAIRDLRKLGIKVFSCDHGLEDMAGETMEPSRVLIRQVFGAIAQYEKSVIVKKLLIARTRVRAEKGKCEGRKYFGEVHEGEKAARLRIISLRQAGLSFRLVAAVLREEGHKHADGSPISQHTCKRVFRRFEEFMKANTAE
jgi:DNA invertase Pin-like site-specific DNA recombinase